MRRRSAAAAANRDALDRSFRLPLTDRQLERLHQAAEARGLSATSMVRGLVLRFADYVLGEKLPSQPIGVSSAETDAYLDQVLGNPRK